MKAEAADSLRRLLAWMQEQDFALLSAGEPSLLRQVELIVVDSHRRLYSAQQTPWSEPVAYRWLRYEDPNPVHRLAEGAAELRRSGAPIDAGAVDKACTEAAGQGFSS